tara:strand:- start:1927 stop:2232 length:306 start_codon:yes stop_codon:yes gene_type:complete
MTAVEEVDYEEVYEPPKTGYDNLPDEVKQSIAKISGDSSDKKADNFVLTYLIFGAAGGAFAYAKKRKVLHGIGLGLIAAYLYISFVDNPTKKEDNDESDVQ